MRGVALPAASVDRYDGTVSPTVFREGGFRFLFFSREEPRAHVHALHARGEAKFSGWRQTVELARNFGLSSRLVMAALRLVREHEDEIRRAWEEHFGR
jgi:hypothetical protein